MKSPANRKILSSFMLAVTVLILFISGCTSSANHRPTVGSNIGIANESQIVSEIQQKHLCGDDARLIKSYENEHSRADVCDNKIVSYKRIGGKLENKTEHNLEDIVARMHISDSSVKKFVISMSFASTTSDWFFTTAEILKDGEAEMFEISHGNLVVNIICGANRNEKSKPCSSSF